ncbi:MAG: VOC family virulence protein [Acidiphilium sp. 37-67-22]|jgi:catechol 2,3-dioxygenase-like lactoylglutathione lyase family enzyme|uniref:VOC family protein n=1 Tax=unclassified Acidiphilium TaxID=2617493 RepID=UPI000BD977EE|nr:MULTISPECIES: VOC family protein [unclassified Acidiphilium]OYW09367.1 MAG: VOC family virulence protein [Acidiphilium sp. 37-67-22]OYV57406.1 MAG: VOC family virulence protein [Acidiphilium sp. 20-67-58]HQT59735.1 VOC family protein [Acidiphilium sp.]HQT74368.1 VOC family protein [Acidiphilium sp.]HQU10786.1 VOC family protein [Acidiphilium sp.]
MKFTVDRIDHVVLTCSDIDATADWYERVLGMEREEFGAERRIALRFGAQKLNLHQAGRDVGPQAAKPAPSALDICFVTALGTDFVVNHLKAQKVDIVEGPAPKIGALGAMRSVYCRDPDGNLVEISSYLEE